MAFCELLGCILLDKNFILDLLKIIHPLLQNSPVATKGQCPEHS